MHPIRMTAVAPAIVILSTLSVTPSARGDIYRWDTGAVIPGTEGIEPGPGVKLDNYELEYADLTGANLTYANLRWATLSRADLSGANLTSSYLYHATLTGANLTGATFTDAALTFATFTDADLTGAVVTGADFRETTSRGFSEEQLYSTSSYQQAGLQRMSLASNDLTGWNFAGQNLTNASLLGAMLTNADFTGAVVTGTRFQWTTSRGFTKEQLYSTGSYQSKTLQGIGLGFNDLSGWDFTNQDLSGASMTSSTLTDADLTGAVVTGVDFMGMSLTKEQLYATASYQEKDLHGIGLGLVHFGLFPDGNDLTGWDFSGQDLTGANMSCSRVSGANFTGAVVAGANFILSRGFTQEQLYSTASYQQRNLQGIQLGGAIYDLPPARLDGNHLAGWDFSSQDLTGADFMFARLSDVDLNGANLTDADLGNAALSGADLTGAVVTGADLSGTTHRGFTAAQLYSTASYQQEDLRGINLGTFWLDEFSTRNDLSGWDLSGQDLTGASLSHSICWNVDLSGAVLKGADFDHTTSRGFTKEQLYSTASYQQKTLRGIVLSTEGFFPTEDDDFTGWNFSGQDLTGAVIEQSTLEDVDLSGANLTNASLIRSTLSGADLTGANLKNTDLGWVGDLESAILDSSTVYSQWTVFPGGFDPVSAGLTLMPSPVGDFNADDVLDATDIDTLTHEVLRRERPWQSWDAMLDLNSDRGIDHEDHRVWVKDLKHTWFGDANLDGEFNSSDMVQVFAAGKYETGEDASWGAGDWDCSGVFDSSDMVAALTDGGYEQGLRTDLAAVPEPATAALMWGTACLLLVCARSGQRGRGV